MGEFVESSNLQQIERLNQRGGPSMSLVDLVACGTLSSEMAGVCAAAVVRGASVLTAAGPGGAGKTTLMAALLGFVAAGRPIVTIENAADLPRPSSASNDDPVYLVHELGAGAWYGYLWGNGVGRYVGLARGNGSISSCLHADAIPELYSILTGSELGCRVSDVCGVGLVLFMKARQVSGRVIRRVSTMNVPGERRHQAAFRWDSASDRFVRSSEISAVERLGTVCGCDGSDFGRLAQGLQTFLDGLLVSGVSGFSEVRRAFLESGLK